MSRVITEATTRGLSCVYAYVRADNKVSSCSWLMVIITLTLIAQAAMFLNRKFGLSQRGECKQDRSLVIMERSLPQPT